MAMERLAVMPTLLYSHMSSCNVFCVCTKYVASECVWLTFRGSKSGGRVVDIDGTLGCQTLRIKK